MRRPEVRFAARVSKAPIVSGSALCPLGDAQTVRIGGLVQLTVRVKPPQPARKGRNPATGAEIALARKPASVVLYGQRVNGIVRVTDVPVAPGGRAYLVERELEQDGNAAARARRGHR
jgi:hypothetical protein